MPVLAAIFSGLARATQRELGTFSSLKVNNLFLLIALMVYGALMSGVAPVSAEPLIVLLFLLSLFPLSSDPLALIPAVRLGLWPLTRRDRIVLRCLSFVVSPVVWLAVISAVLTKQARIGVAVFVLSGLVHVVKAVVLRSTVRRPGMDLLRHIPQFPGQMGGLIRNDLRDMMSTLDPYPAIVFSVGGTIYRFAGTNVDPYAPAVLSLLVGLCLSTYAQCLFGLDIKGTALTRYRLLPLPGWRILLAKDIAFLLVLTVLVAPLNLASGLTFGLAALAIGHHPSVLIRSPIHRWRFAGSRLFPGVVQAVVAIVLGFAAHQRGILFLVASTGLYGASLLVYGRLFERLLRPVGTESPARVGRLRSHPAG